MSLFSNVYYDNCCSCGKEIMMVGFPEYYSDIIICSDCEKVAE